MHTYIIFCATQLRTCSCMLVCDMLACEMSIFIYLLSVSQWIRKFSLLMPSELAYSRTASVH
jgi:hypothetical protein